MPTTTPQPDHGPEYGELLLAAARPSLYPSVLRTAVPLLVGWVLTAAGFLGIHPDSTAVTAAATTAFTGAYYLVFRLLEQLAVRVEWEPLRLAAGLFLGWARPPQYPKRGGALPPAPTDSAGPGALRPPTGS
ncbi:hypothetical protein ACFWPV_09690 [Streptomyces uncialis]|uniref:hypothetical protein n=1 Tax=Streptomyces uncialis TaxID=1048205 RepID=UPI00365897B4